MKTRKKPKRDAAAQRAQVELELWHIERVLWPNLKRQQQRIERHQRRLLRLRACLMGQSKRQSEG